MRSIAGAAVALSLVGLVASSGGCEVLITNDVPAYTCSPSSLANCPPGMYCKGAGCVQCDKVDPCDGYDNDCDGIIDDGPLSDADKDSWPVCGKIDPATGQFVDKDCDDNDPTVHPYADEKCNGKDNDCDGDADTEGCAQGQVCIGKTGQCVNQGDLCTATSCTPPKICDPDTRQCVDPPTVDVGGACTSDAQCNTHICGTAAILGSDVVKGSTGVCTKPCCTSGDCPTGFVCYAAGTGGDYCVSAQTVSRGATGSAGGGASCGGGSQCRSGLCDGSHCVDTCCGDSQCSGGTACVLSSAAGIPSFQCAPTSGTRTPNQSCYNDPDCRDGFCYDYGFGTRRCLGKCCGSAGCGEVDIGFYVPAVCVEVDGTAPNVSQLPPNDEQDVCAAVSGTIGSAVLGEACSSGSDCRSGRCNASIKRCTDVCCTDDDCRTVGWACRPSGGQSGVALRCVPR